eukprot:2671968-Prymnesium_polylepis.1
MKLGYNGEAFFVTETFPSMDGLEQLVPLAHITSPPAAGPIDGDIPGEFSLDRRATPPPDADASASAATSVAGTSVAHAGSHGGHYDASFAS